MILFAVEGWDPINFLPSAIVNHLFLCHNSETFPKLLMRLNIFFKRHWKRKRLLIYFFVFTYMLHDIYLCSFANLCTCIIQKWNPLSLGIFLGDQTGSLSASWVGEVNESQFSLWGALFHSNPSCQDADTEFESSAINKSYRKWHL